MISGRVIEEQKNYFLVDTSQGVFRSGIKGTLKKTKTRVCVGDLVEITITSDNPPEGLITNIEKRSSFIHRPALANLTQILFITTFKSPNLDLEALDRMLFTSEVYGIKPVIVFNKIDLLDSTESDTTDTIIDIYKKCGYSVFKTSVQVNYGIDELGAICKNEISAFSGLSGVGKSSLLSKLFPDKSFKIGEVSGNTGRGTHTTTNIILHPYTADSYIADTPGISFVNIPSVQEEEVVTCFPEIAAYTGKCRFNNCIHNGEPGCLVQEQIELKEIATFRQEHYLKIYNEMKTIRKQYRKNS
jgi:ribosome biogenesis GTPase